MNSFSTRLRCSSVSRVLALVVALSTSAAFAGQPFICHPYEIGSAPSLPVGTYGKGVSATYDRATLVPDTLALLTPSTPVLVRMETLRRAAIYATANLRGWAKGSSYTPEDRTLANGLLGKLRERTTTARSTDLAVALFDLGFFAETLKQTGLDPALDGLPLLVKAHELRGADAEMEFALAVACAAHRGPELAGYLEKVRSAAKDNSLLATNLASHF